MPRIKIQNEGPSGTVTPAVLDDMPEILSLQKLCYQSEAALHDDYNIPPLLQTLDDIRVEFSRKIFLKFCSGKQIVGSVRGSIDSGTCYVGRLIVHPDFQNRSIGSALLRAIESQFPKAERYELFTGHKSEKNLHLYKARGYRIFKTERVNAKLTMVFLEKVYGGKISPEQV
jgi:ribosomal protein S18 acetylase RimI-like enzyme